MEEDSGRKDMIREDMSFSTSSGRRLEVGADAIGKTLTLPFAAYSDLSFDMARKPITGQMI